MEAMEERRIWQRVRGTEGGEDLRGMLQRQGDLASQYRQLSRRGGKFRQLFDQKEAQIACLRGMLRVRTGQSIAHPRYSDGPVELLKCYAQEKAFLQELTELSPDPIYASMRDRQACQCRLVLEILGSMN